MFGKGPKTLVCYICGREFGTSSLGIHQKKCKELFIAREKTKPKNERRPLPKPPSAEQASSVAARAVGGGGGGGMTREEFNEAARQTFNTEAMKACPHCARTFLEDRLVIHLRSCRPDSKARPVGAPRVGGGGGGALNLDRGKGCQGASMSGEPMRNTTPGQRKKSTSRAAAGGPATARRKPSVVGAGGMKPGIGSAAGSSPYALHTEVPKRPVTMASGSRSRRSSNGVSRVEMIQMVDDAEDGGLLSEELATKLHRLMTTEDAMLRDIYLAAKAASGKSVQRFARNAKRLLEQRAHDASASCEDTVLRSRSKSTPTETLAM